MDIDKEKQAQAMAKARQSLLQAEIKREEARLNKNIALFLQEKFDVLLNDEFVEKLAENINRQYRGDQRKTALDLFEKLEKSICHEQAAIRERSLIVMMLLSEHVYNNNIKELCGIIARMASNWLYFENEFIAGFEPVCNQLQRIVVEMLSSQQWYEAEQLIVTLNKISNKSLLKNNLIFGVVSRVHDKLADPEVLDTMVNAYLGESSQRKDVVENILLNMGRQGSQFLIQRLTHSNDKEERLALLDLIPRIGDVSVPVLTRYLQGSHPWYVTRNIIMIVTRLRKDELYNAVKPHLSHEDVRVQQQVVNCIEVLGGEQTAPRLIDALFTINDDLKNHLIDQLIQFNSPEVESALLELLERRESFSSHVSDFLITKICSKLHTFPSEKSISALSALIDERRERYGDGDAVTKAAQATLQSMEQTRSRDATFSSAAEDDSESDLIDEVLAQIPADPAAISEDYSDGGLSDIFVETLTDTLTNKKPESREPAATQMFQTHHSQDHHLMVWSGFYEQLDTQEANRFFSMLMPQTVQPGTVIVDQEADEADLYFIDHGYADIHFLSESSDVRFTPLQAGEIIGGDASLHGQPWPVSIRAQTELQIRKLEQTQLTALKDELPELLPKLEYYCRRHDVIPYFVRTAVSADQPEHGIDVEVRSSAIFRTADGQHIDAELTGTLIHCVEGGFSISLPVTGRKNAAVSLGHQVTAELELEDGARQTCFGIIAGSGFYESPDTRLHVHVKLYHPLENADYICKAIDIM